MPQDEDWMPINGNPHPVPGVPFPEMPPFNLPAFPALGWNAVPPPPPVDNAVADDNWGNWDDDVDPEPVQDQESMVVDLSAQPSSDTDTPVPPVVVLDDEQPEAPVLNEDFASDQWAMVVYQPPVVTEEFAMPAVPYGPPLPPELIWRRSFEALFQAPMVISVPKPVTLRPLSPVILSKRSWDFAFSDMNLPRLTWKDQEVARPVARALFVDSEPDQVISVAIPAVANARRPRQPLAPTPIVDTAVRRCTRSSVKRDGFKPVFHELAIQPKKKKPRAKPFMAHESDEQASEEIPPATPIVRLQEIGRELEIEATLLSMDALMVDPLASKSVDPDV
ncbi:hypothetical protein VPH35_073513 [Triticum aestivum]